MKVREILETAVYADDLDAARQFYSRLLGLEEYSYLAGRHVFFRCGQRMLLIFRSSATLQPESPFPAHGATGPGHVAFAVPQSELNAWRRHLEENDVSIEADVKWDGGRSIYVRDPAGNSVELASPGIWRIPEDDVFSS